LFCEQYYTARLRLPLRPKRQRIPAQSIAY
jgi:hypothetical protein